MIEYTQGNLLEAHVDALVNTVNTVGVMGKGIALMFAEAFPGNREQYEQACKQKKLSAGRLFVTRRSDMLGPEWIVNFATKGHWRYPSRMEWIESGLDDLRAFVLTEGVRSIALPPLGAGNGRLDWREVRECIERKLGDLADVKVVVYEPTDKYQNVAKRRGVEKLTPARALIAEMVRRYWILGIQCSLLEIQKLAWFLERNLEVYAPENPLDLRFAPDRYGPYADRLRHLLDGLDGSYLRCYKRLADARPADVIRFADERREVVATYLHSAEAAPFARALQETVDLIDGFETPLGMELLATVDWLLTRERCPATEDCVLEGLARWPGGQAAGQRKLRIFDRRMVQHALRRLVPWQERVAAAGSPPGTAPTVFPPTD